MNPLTQRWASQNTSRRSAISVGAMAVVLLAVVAVFTIFRKPSDPVVVEVATAVPTVSATSVVTLPEPSPTEVGVPTIKSLKELKERFGDPPTANRGRLRIPGLGVDAPIGARAVPASLQMPAPTGPSDVVLYDFSVAPQFGGWPGGGGNAVLSGHVDYSYKLPYANANYTGLGVFALLRTAQPGSDQVQITLDGRTTTYTVEWVRTISAHSGNWGDVLSHDAGGDVITIVTCDGAFNPATLEYSDRTVLRAVRSS
ncbi:MAG: class F sortase [Chloroflexi bacterium]|nr:MAG: class F sortase [Chloroflexota bacterium]